MKVELKNAEDMTVEEIKAELLGRIKGKTADEADAILNADNRKERSPRGSAVMMFEIVAKSKELASKKAEHVLVYLLDGKNRLIGVETVSVGTTTMALAHPREIFRTALLKNAHKFILVHNHPSGDPTPSEEDVRLTKRVAQAGMIVGIELVDHLIVADRGCYSLKSAGQL